MYAATFSHILPIWGAACAVANPCGGARFARSDSAMAVAATFSLALQQVIGRRSQGAQRALVVAIPATLFALQ